MKKSKLQIYIEWWDFYFKRKSLKDLHKGLKERDLINLSSLLNLSNLSNLSHSFKIFSFFPIFGIPYNYK